jgi:hypothetical protein
MHNARYMNEIHVICFIHMGLTHVSYIVRVLCTNHNSTRSTRIELEK